MKTRFNLFQILLPAAMVAVMAVASCSINVDEPPEPAPKDLNKSKNTVVTKDSITVITNGGSSSQIIESTKEK